MAEKSKLDTIANIAIIVVCLIASTVLIRNYFFPPRPPGAPQGIEKGETVAALGKVVPAGSDRALVIAVSPTCHWCDASMPFYTKLVDERDKKSSGVKVVAVVPAAEAREPEAKKFSDAGVKPDSMVDLSFAEIKVPGTPTVLLVDNEGKVLDVWVGNQDESGEKEILRAL